LGRKVPRTQNIVALALDRQRQERLLDVFGGDGFAFTEIETAMTACLSEQTRSALVNAAILAFRRDAMLEGNPNLPIGMTKLWLKLDRPARAETIARSQDNSGMRSLQLSLVGEHLAGEGKVEQLQQLCEILDPAGPLFTLQMALAAVVVDTPWALKQFTSIDHDDDLVFGFLVSAVSRLALEAPDRLKGFVENFPSPYRDLALAHGLAKVAISDSSMLGDLLDVVDPEYRDIVEVQCLQALALKNSYSDPTAIAALEKLTRGRWKRWRLMLRGEPEDRDLMLLAEAVLAQQLSRTEPSRSARLARRIEKRINRVSNEQVSAMIAILLLRTPPFGDERRARRLLASARIRDHGTGSERFRAMFLSHAYDSIIVDALMLGENPRVAAEFRPDLVAQFCVNTILDEADDCDDEELVHLIEEALPTFGLAGANVVTEYYAALIVLAGRRKLPLVDRLYDLAKSSLDEVLRKWGVWDYFRAAASLASAIGPFDRDHALEMVARIEPADHALEAVCDVLASIADFDRDRAEIKAYNLERFCRNGMISRNADDGTAKLVVALACHDFPKAIDVADCISNPMTRLELLVRVTTKNPEEAGIWSEAVARQVERSLESLRETSRPSRYDQIKGLALASRLLERTDPPRAEHFLTEALRLCEPEDDFGDRPTNLSIFLEFCSPSLASSLVDDVVNDAVREVGEMKDPDRRANLWA
jgi:hypothetical protein